MEADKKDSQEKYSPKFNKVKADVTEGLKRKSSILIQSKPGTGKNKLISDAAKDAGLNLLTLEISNLTKKSELHVDNSVESRKKLVMSYMLEQKANALFVNMAPTDDPVPFIDIAKSLDVPLIVSITNKLDFSVTMMHNKDIMLPFVMNDNPTKLVTPKVDVIKRIQALRDIDETPWFSKRPPNN